MKFLKFALLLLSVLAITVNACKKDPDTKPGDAFMISFSAAGVNGTINEAAKTVALELPPSEDITAVVPTIVVSQDATVSPASGEAKDFTNPVAYTVTDKSGTVKNVYTVTMTQVDLKHFAFLGVAAENTPAAWDALKGPDYDLKDDQTAAEWFMAHMATSTSDVAYHSFVEVASGSVDLSQYDAIWIHFDGGWWGGEVAQFPNNPNWCLLKEDQPIANVGCETLASNFVSKVRAYYEAGGNLFLGLYAGSMVDELGVVSSPDAAPNNSFGGIGIETCCTNDAWGVRWASDPTNPMFNGIVTSTDPNCLAPFFILLDSGTEKKNRSNQYNLNFGPWAPNGDVDPLEDRLAAFQTMVGGTIHMHNCGMNEPLMIEWAANAPKGKVITVLAGTYDWYVGAGIQNNDNIPTLTKNILNYLAE